MPKPLFVAVAAVFVLSACAVPPTPEPLPTETPTAVPTATPSPSPTPDPLLFKDDFEGSLAEGWNWVREDSKRWSLTNNPGWLEIMAGGGNINGGTMKNLLLRQAPEGDFQLETRLKFKPEGNFQIAGLLVYESDGHYVLFGRAFCGNPNCAGNGFYMDLLSGGKLTGGNFATKAPDVDTVYLRLVREGNTFNGLISEDAKQWTLIGAHIDALTPLFVGIAAGQAAGTVPKPAQFDYYTISRLP